MRGYAERVQARATPAPLASPNRPRAIWGFACVICGGRFAACGSEPGHAAIRKAEVRSAEQAQTTPRPPAAGQRPGEGIRIPSCAVRSCFLGRVLVQSAVKSVVWLSGAGHDICTVDWRSSLLPGALFGGYVDQLRGPGLRGESAA
jgi:hypothetical protein